MNLASKVVEKMINGDAFSNWLGIEILEITNSFCRLKLKVREEMTNGFKIINTKNYGKKKKRGWL